jgi:NitT/TauT family transport system ATP-binding protein
MSSRPGRIIEDCPVPFERPRNVAMSYASEFSELVQQLRMRIAHARSEGVTA